jgi:cysteinyl-tRNA synthetase
LGEIVGILQMDPEEFLQGDISDDFAAKIEQLIVDRNNARKNKNYAQADRIRDELQKLNVTIEDSATGTTWRKIN